MPAQAYNSPQSIWLRRFSKLTCFGTLFLIFVGGLVTSTGSGLSVPDWPLSYGMLFPPMVGGVFYEHGHRMIASLVGLCMLILAVWLARAEKRRWVRNLGFVALAAVIIQGILGGITVKFFLPTPVSVAHGILAQTFFILTIIIAYSQSAERSLRAADKVTDREKIFIRSVFFITVLIYLQLIIGAIMRHTHSGLAIPDFPTMGWEVIPKFDTAMQTAINSWRFDVNLDPVTMPQIAIHFIHRLGALVIFTATVFLVWKARQVHQQNQTVMSSVYLFFLIIIFQVILGISTILTLKAPYITSFHVMAGAGALGFIVLLLLRVSPIEIKTFKKVLTS